MNSFLTERAGVRRAVTVRACAGLDLEAGLAYPNLISPADLYNLIAHQT